MTFLKKLQTQYEQVVADFRSDLKSFGKGLVSKYGATEVHLSLTHDNHIAINAIIIPKDSRGEGIGSKIMQEITNYADKHKKIIVLDPSTDFGATSINRLKKFYSRFGFVKNSGRKKNFQFSQAMIRNPK